jgi:hypothetical protein
LTHNHNMQTLKTIMVETKERIKQKKILYIYRNQTVYQAENHRITITTEKTKIKDWRHLDEFSLRCLSLTDTAVFETIMSEGVVPVIWRRDSVVAR